MIPAMKEAPAPAAITARPITTAEATANLAEVIDCHHRACELFGVYFIKGVLGDGKKIDEVAVCEDHAIDIGRYPTSYGLDAAQKIYRLIPTKV